MRLASLSALAPVAMFAAACAALPGPAGAADATSDPAALAAAALPFADLAALADGAPLVIRAVVKDQAVLEAERAPGLPVGMARLYVEAETQALLAGTVPVGQSLRYLVDVPLDAKGKAPKLKKREMVLFARPVAGRPDELVLVTPDAQLAYSPELEARLRPLLAELAASDAPPRLTAVRDALAVAGTLAGESETQIFIDTATGEPASITVTRRPGQAPRWGVSWNEIVDQSAAAPAPATLAWYRLACSLPARLPAGANLAADAPARALATRDYAYVIAQLGPCTRSR